jgi:hypothetical protein
MADAFRGRFFGKEKNGWEDDAFYKTKERKGRRKMKNFYKLLAIAMVAVIGFSFTACGIIGGGSFTLTGIPAKSNGKYAIVYAAKDDASLVLVGVQAVNKVSKSVTLSPISNGNATVPLWKVNKNGSMTRYSGNDTLMVIVGIMDSEKMDSTDPAVILSRIAGANTFLSTKFSNGNAEEAWNKGVGGGMLGNMLKGLKF